MNMKMKLFNFAWLIAIFLMAFFVYIPNAKAEASASFSFKNYEKNVDDVFQVPVYFNLSNSEPLSVGCGQQGANIKISFNPSVLKAQSVDSGDYSRIIGNIDNNNGTVYATTVMYEASSGCGGQLLSGNIVVITFRVMSKGSSNLSFLPSGNSYHYYKPIGGGYSDYIEVPLSFSNGQVTNPKEIIPTPTPTPTQPNTLTTQPNISTTQPESDKTISTQAQAKNNSQPVTIQDTPKVAELTTTIPQDNNIKAVQGDTTTKKPYTYLYIVLIAVLFAGGLLIGINYQKIKNKLLNRNNEKR